MKPKPEWPVGKMVWSDYFNHWCIVVYFEDDDNWWFVIPGKRSEAMKAQTKFSEMKK